MIDVDINADDIVIAEKRANANTGDIVVSIVDNELTL
jgi:SOS-response transcriptional repressor LexA